MHLGDPNDPRLEEVSGVYLRQYHSLVPIDDRTAGQRRQPSLTVPTALYKGTSETDGETYAIRKLLAPPLMEDAISRGRVWVAMGHPNIVRLVEIFTSHDEGQPLSYVVQAFHPNALTLEQAFLQQRMPVTEDVLWGIALQIIAAIHAVHNAGLSVRSLDLNTVLLTSKETVRLSSAGFLDIIRPDNSRSLHQHQHEDLLSLGQLLVNLSCTSPTAASQQSLQKSTQYIQATFSQEFSALLLLLLSAPQPTIHDAVALTSGRMMRRVSQTQWHVDALTSELNKECENGRLLRLLVKLNTVADRESLGENIDWGASADRRLLRLFRDSVFHAVNDDGSAVVDFASIVHSLNKLDYGHEGKTILSSNTERNGGDLLLVSHRDLASVLDRSFAEVVESQAAAEHAAGGGGGGGGGRGGGQQSGGGGGGGQGWQQQQQQQQHWQQQQQQQQQQYGGGGYDVS